MSRLRDIIQHKLKEFEREGMKIQMESEDLAIIQKGTVDYIGFSYYMSTVSTAYPEEVKYVGGNQMLRLKILICKNLNGAGLSILRVKNFIVSVVRSLQYAIVCG